MESRQKKVSIITINYNNAAGLEKTIESVVSQSFKDYEYLIIDGGSTDGSREIIQRYAEKITYWVSERDKGVYNAMNKAIVLAKGEYCYFLNSGDHLWRPDSLGNIFLQGPTEDIIYGNMIQGGANTIEHGLPKLTFYDFFIGSIYHQSAFIKRELFEKIGLYNEEYKVVSDWEFFLKAIFIHNCSTKYVNADLALYEIGGLSFQDLDANLRDRKRILNELFPRFTEDYADYDKFKRSNYTGIYHFIENSKIAGLFLGSIMGFTRFIRFTLLRQKRKHR